MGEEDAYIVVGNASARETDHGNGVENYECDGCRSTAMGCGGCPHNKERIEEYRKKYIY